MEEEEHEVYGGEIPDVEGDMDPHNADVDMSAAEDDAVKVRKPFLHSIFSFF
jgi:polyadenylate-binding protein 2